MHDSGIPGKGRMYAMKAEITLVEGEVFSLIEFKKKTS